MVLQSQSAIQVFGVYVFVPLTLKGSLSKSPAPSWEATQSERLGNQTKVLASQAAESEAMCIYVCVCVEVKSHCRQVPSEWAACEVHAVTWETPHWNLSPL